MLIFKMIKVSSSAIKFLTFGFDFFNDDNSLGKYIFLQ